MATVKFNDVDEFLGELKSDAERVWRKLLRLTCRHRAEAAVPMRSLTVVATAMIDGHVVALESRLGSYFPETTEATEVSGRAKQQMTAISAAAGELGLEIRPGVFEAA